MITCESATSTRSLAVVASAASRASCALASSWRPVIIHVSASTSPASTPAPAARAAIASRAASWKSLALYARRAAVVSSPGSTGCPASSRHVATRTGSSGRGMPAASMASATILSTLSAPEYVHRRPHRFAVQRMGDRRQPSVPSSTTSTSSAASRRSSASRSTSGATLVEVDALGHREHLERGAGSVIERREAGSDQLDQSRRQAGRTVQAPDAAFGVQRPAGCGLEHELLQVQRVATARLPQSAGGDGVDGATEHAGEQVTGLGQRQSRELDPMSPAAGPEARDGVGRRLARAHRRHGPAHTLDDDLMDECRRAGVEALGVVDDEQLGRLTSGRRQRTLGVGEHRRPRRSRRRCR